MPRTGREQRVAVEQLEVAGQLLDAVDLAAPLDLHGDGRAVGVAAHQVDRADRGRVLAADQGQPVGERRRVLGEQLLQVLLDAVLLQARVDAEVVAGVVEDLLEQDPQGVARVLAGGPRLVHSTWPSSVVPSRSEHGGDIQFSGL